MTPQEENVYLPDFSPAREHLLLKGLYENYLHHKDRLYLDGGVLDDAIW